MFLMPFTEGSSRARRSQACPFPIICSSSCAGSPTGPQSRNCARDWRSKPRQTLALLRKRRSVRSAMPSDRGLDASALLEALLQTPVATAVEERLFDEGLPLHAL